jgi:hypothetical protein
MLGSDIVKLCVGDPKSPTIFQAHKKILCKKVTYFDKMFNGNFKEGAEQCATFPEDDPLIWKSLIGWVYSGLVEEPTSRTINPCDLTTDKIKIYALAEKYGIIELQDKTMDPLNHHFCLQSLIPSLASVARGYKLTHSGSKLRLLLARTLAYHTLRTGEEYLNRSWSSPKLVEVLKKNEDLLLDSLTLMRESSGKVFPNPTNQPACDYHQHAKTEPCPYAKKS